MQHASQKASQRMTAAVYIAASLGMLAVAIVLRRRLRKIEKTENMFLVLPDVYRPYGSVEKMRLIIEYNMRVGPVAAHLDNGDKLGFLSAHVRYKNIEGCLLTRWTIFLDDYMKLGVNNVTAVATHVWSDAMRLTLSSENVVLHEMVLGVEFI